MLDGQSTPIANEYLSPDDLVARYRRLISPRTLANWRSKGEGPRFTKIGGKVLYNLSDVISWEKTRRMLREFGILKILLAKAALSGKAIGILWCLLHPFI